VTADAALRSLRAAGAGRLVLAVPVTPTDTAARLADVADDLVWVLAPRRFGAVGSWYSDFAQVADDEVLELLDAHRTRG
jgi:putative phosphoribosyl transferase